MKREEDPVRRTALAAALCFAFAAAPALAGLTGVLEERAPGGKTSTGKMMLETDRLRMETEDGTFIFRGDRQVLWMISEKDKTYRELTKADIDKIAGQMNALMPQIEEQLKGMSPEERAMVESMMKGKMGAGMVSAAKKTYVKSGGSETINGFACSNYDAMKGDKKVARVCAADWKALGVTSDDVKVFTSMYTFIEPMMGALADMMPGLVQKSGPEGDKSGIPGFPVRTTTFGKKGDRVEELKSLTRGDVPASSFDLPPGLKKEAMETAPQQ